MQLLLMVHYFVNHIMLKVIYFVPVNISYTTNTPHSPLTVITISNFPCFVSFIQFTSLLNVFFTLTLPPE